MIKPHLFWIWNPGGLCLKVANLEFLFMVLTLLLVWHRFDCFIYEFTHRRFTHRRERQQKLSAMATTDVIYKDKDKTVSVHDLLAYRLKKRRGEEVESDFFIAKEILHVI